MLGGHMCVGSVPKGVDTRSLCLVSGAGSLTEPGASLADQHNQVALLASSTPRAGRLQMCCDAQLFYVGAGGSNSRPHDAGWHLGNRAISPAWEC